MPNKVLMQIRNTALDVYNKIKKKKQPTLTTPIRALSNVTYNVKAGFFELNGKMKTRTLTASTVKSFAQTLRMMALSKE